MIFIGEILLQSKIANIAFERLKETENNFDKLEVWCSLQSILVSAGNVSKILWSRKASERGKRLRELLHVEEHSILSNRKFRNHFEHYDERIEEWFGKRSGGVYIDLAMNPSFGGGFAGSEHRGYNSIDHTLMFRGERLDLNDLMSALQEVQKHCKSYVLDYP